MTKINNLAIRRGEHTGNEMFEKSPVPGVLTGKQTYLGKIVWIPVISHLICSANCTCAAVQACEEA